MAVADIMESLQPAIQRLKVAKAEEVGIDTLRERLLQENASGQHVLVGRSEVGIWTSVPKPAENGSDQD
ncbi:hypothetical protein NG895_15085 [Aeoliella sp. ICT_H6.2]|uniref:Uncharacterized protein n=1 Tax=Aeoliella straminimaris TaxID=2954799 RepID=A0A9X2FB09_9BACT|nr:hypothetical protein [Aeoliella straminimaris]MCO6045234.1 hypothetical protein [Aeoliella straminimaris]